MQTLSASSLVSVVSAREIRQKFSHAAYQTHHPRRLSICALKLDTFPFQRCCIAKKRVRWVYHFSPPYSLPPNRVDGIGDRLGRNCPILLRMRECKVICVGFSQRQETISPNVTPLKRKCVSYHPAEKCFHGNTHEREQTTLFDVFG
jgi:hypothetical protein